MTRVLGVMKRPNRIELEILNALIENKTRQEIAMQRGVAVSTIQTQIEAMSNRYCVSGKLELVMLALCQGWVEFPDWCKGGEYE